MTLIRGLVFQAGRSVVQVEVAKQATPQPPNTGSPSTGWVLIVTCNGQGTAAGPAPITLPGGVIIHFAQGNATAARHGTVAIHAGV